MEDGPVEDGQRAVIDRFVDDAYAVVLVGEEQLESVVSITVLPEGAAEGSWLRLWFAGGNPRTGEVQKIELDLSETDQARERIARKLAQLKERGRSK